VLNGIKKIIAVALGVMALAKRCIHIFERIKDIFYLIAMAWLLMNPK